MADSLPVKTAQQMAIDGDKPPSKYIIKNNSNYTKFGPLEIHPPSAPIPIIDMSFFFSSSKQQNQESELQKLRSALTTWGCFQAVNHGLSNSYLDNVREIIKQFFALPFEEKRKYFRETGSVEGYGNDMTYSENQVQDWCDRLFLRIFPEDERKLQFWPQTPSNFREAIDEYTKKIKAISLVLFEAMAKSLNLEENCFSKQFMEERDIVQGRFILYPPCPTPDKVFGLKAHSDRSGITLLLQDPGVEGLQVLNDGQWYRVPVISDALFVNLGDQMQIMSNGIFKSPVHRVVTNADKGRISVAMFTEPEPTKEISPVEALADEERPRIYKTVKNYAVFNHECFQKGIVALDAVKF